MVGAAVIVLCGGEEVRSAAAMAWSSRFTGAGAGLYRPPKLSAVAMEEGEEGGRRSAKDRRRDRDASRRGGRSALVRFGRP